MKRQSFQTKRRPTNSGLFVFHSKTRRRKKQRVAASASADLGSEVPNLGVARALFVILILHVAAIAAIFVHNRVTEDDPVSSVAGSEEAAANAISAGDEDLPVIRDGEDFYFVATGDTYDTIAKLKGVDVSALRDFNNNVRLKAGRILRVPPVRAAVAAVPEVQPAPRREPQAAPRPAPQPAAAPPVAEAPPAVRPIMVKRETPAQPIRVVADEPETDEKPAVKVAPRAVPVKEETPAAAGGTYTVQRGDTLYSIARKYKMSVSKLLEANATVDPRKMRIGMTLEIPAN